MDFLRINTLYIELTHACNQQCKHCYLNGGMHHTVAEMSTEQIKKIFHEFKEQGGRSAVITGGEPLMRKDIWDILDYVEELEIPFTFASNSLAMNAERRERLASYKYLALYFTSILGVDRKKHQYITEKDSYDNVMETLGFFTEHSIATYVQVTLAKDYVDDMEKIADDLMKFDNCVVKFTPIATLGVKEEDATEEQKHLIVLPEEFPAFHNRVENLQKKYLGRIEDSNIQNYDQIRSVIADYENEKLYSLVYGFVAVRPNGDLSFSCNMGNPYTFGKAYESMKIPVDEKLREYIEVLRRAEQATLEKAREEIIEFDVTVDKFVAEMALILRKRYMKDVILKSERVEMKFPLPFITSQMIVEAISDKETIEFMDAVPTMEYTEENALSFIEFLKYTEYSDEELELGIFDIETNKFIGMCTLENINREYSVCELGYWLNKEYVGKGYMTECVKAIIQYAKEELQMKSVNAFVITEHEKSIALLERLGFVRKELLEKDTKNKGKEVDRYWYKLGL